MSTGRLYVDDNACMGCGVCLTTALEDAIIIKDGLVNIINDECEDGCECLNACLFGNIKQHF